VPGAINYFNFIA